QGGRVAGIDDIGKQRVGDRQVRQQVILSGRRLKQHAAIERRANIGQCDAGGVVLIGTGGGTGRIRAGEQVEQAAVETPGAAAACLIRTGVNGIRQSAVACFARLRLAQVDL